MTTAFLNSSLTQNKDRKKSGTSDQAHEYWKHVKENPSLSKDDNTFKDTSKIKKFSNLNDI